MTGAGARRKSRRRAGRGCPGVWGFGDGDANSQMDQQTREFECERLSPITHSRPSGTVTRAELIAQAGRDMRSRRVCLIRRTPLSAQTGRDFSSLLLYRR
jgi:hypothetical protein